MRIQKQLTQEELAQVLKIQRGTLANWEIGRTEPDLATISHLADYFNVSVDYLLGRSDDPGNFTGKYITPDDLDISDEDKAELKKYMEYAVAIDEAKAAKMTPEDVKYLIEFAKNIKKNELKKL
ncbi:HTH-type transcriptional regulator Xre [bioreactor metagenome]|uniref:HTH-type transcriptional regulator Xre n=1 Tax=bioreactor metagenome TaxID=1076179 RepID=A0A645F838_9ZZZZ